MDKKVNSIIVLEKLIPIDDLLNGCINIPVFVECCKQCPNYSTSWACPPFPFDVITMLKSYSYFYICAAKSSTNKRLLRKSYSQDELNAICETISSPLTEKVHKRLLDYSNSLNDCRIVNPDGCHMCEEIGCSRLKGNPCRFPQKMTYSLEALGLDAKIILERYFDEELQWGKNGKLAPYYFRIGGVLLPK